MTDLRPLSERLYEQAYVGSPEPDHEGWAEEARAQESRIAELEAVVDLAYWGNAKAAQDAARVLREGKS